MNCLKISSSISWFGAILSSLMAGIGIFAFFQTELLKYKLAMICYTLVSIFFVIYSLLKDELFLDSSDNGIVVYRKWTFVGMQTRRVEGLKKAQAIIVRVSDDFEQHYLLFDDNTEFPIPSDKKATIKILKWFRENYQIDLIVKTYNGSFMPNWKEEKLVGDKLVETTESRKWRT